MILHIIIVMMEVYVTKTMKKSQVSTEFMFFVAAGFVLLAVYLLISYNYLDLTLKRRDINSAINLLEELRNEINLASRVENGYTRKYVLPSNINKQNYTLAIPNNGREINIKFNGVDYARLLATQVTVVGSAPIPGDTIIIKKENEEVKIQKY